MSLIRKHELYDDQSDINTKVTPFGRLKVANATRIVGTSFSGTTKDPNFWTETVTGSGSVTQAGEIILATGTTADSTAKYQSVRYARHVAGIANELKFTGRLSTDPQANNLRRCGVYDANNGFFFQVNGTTFGVGARKATSDTIVNSGSFNGNLGASLVMTTAIGNFVIWYWERVVYFFIDGYLLHKMPATTTSLTNSLSLPITMECNNTGGNTTDNSFQLFVASVVRFGDLRTEATSYFIGVNETRVLKYGAGHVHDVTVTDNAGTLLIYDGLSAAGRLLANFDASKTVGTMVIDAQFSTGLTYVSAGTPKMTISYE